MLPDQIFKTVIPRTVRLSEAPSFGKSILHYDIKSKGSEAYLSLAKEIVMRKPRLAYREGGVVFHVKTSAGVPALNDCEVFPCLRMNVVWGAVWMRCSAT